MRAYHTGRSHRAHFSESPQGFSHYDNNLVLNPRNKYLTGLNMWLLFSPWSASPRIQMGRNFNRTSIGKLRGPEGGKAEVVITKPRRSAYTWKGPRANWTLISSPSKFLVANSKLRWKIKMTSVKTPHPCFYSSKYLQPILSPSYIKYSHFIFHF